jgi:hypothetical protein
MHAAIERLDEQVGGDPSLANLRGNAFVAEGKLDAAAKIADARLIEEPRDLDAHLLLVSISLAGKDFSKTAKLLTKIRDELGVPLNDLTQVPQYAEFVASPEYAQWQQKPQ